MIDYNIVNLSIENGLKNYEIASNKNYIHLLEVPPLANVRVKLNNNMGDDIPLKENYAIKSGLIEKIYISADSVPGGTIKIGQSNSADGFEIITAPTINSIESLGSIDYLKDNFAPKTATQVSINSGTYYEFDTNTINQIRFNADDFVGVDINLNGVKYEMLEDLINLRNISNNIRFYNDTASTVNLIIWSM